MTSGTRSLDGEREFLIGLDGQVAGKSLREIAEDLYGARSVAADWNRDGLLRVRTRRLVRRALDHARRGRSVSGEGKGSAAASEATSIDTVPDLDVTWVDITSGTEVQREVEPWRLLRVRGRAGPGDLNATSYWLGDLAYTVIALATGVWLPADWSRIDSEVPFDEAEERNWIAIQIPIPGVTTLTAGALHRSMQILRALAAMDRPDGLSVESAPAGDGKGTLMRARPAPRWRAEDKGLVSDDIIVCQAPLAPWQGLLELTRAPGSIALRGADSVESAAAAHAAHRLRLRLRESGYRLCTQVTVMHDGSGGKRAGAMAWGIARTDSASGAASGRELKLLLEGLARAR